MAVWGEKGLRYRLLHKVSVGFDSVRLFLFYNFYFPFLLCSLTQIVGHCHFIVFACTSFDLNVLVDKMFEISVKEI